MEKFQSWGASSGYRNRGADLKTFEELEYLQDMESLGMRVVKREEYQSILDFCLSNGYMVIKLTDTMKTEGISIPRLCCCWGGGSA